MKRILRMLIVFAACLTMAACGKTDVSGTASRGETMSWQEQYDLGIRLLSEDNYEEAILVFQAMIQIDPKQSEAYRGLADAYIGVGEYEKAVSVLTEGYQITGETSLEEKRQDVQEQIEALENRGETTDGTAEGMTEGDPSGQLTSPLEAPELPDVLTMEYMTTPILYTEEEYIVFDQDTMAIWTAAVEAGLEDDKEALSTALDAIDVEAVKEFSRIYHEEYYDLVAGWTMWQDALLGYTCYIEPDGSVEWILEYRPAEGTGFTVIWSGGDNGSTREFWIGDMSQHVYEGAYRYTYEELQQGQVVYTSTTDGGAAQELYHGSFTIRQEGQGAPVIVLYYQYENGVMQQAWEDPSTGDMCHLKRVEIQADGTENVAYMYFGDSGTLCYVTGFLGEN